MGDWNARVGSQETPGVTGKFGLGVQNEARKKDCFAGQSFAKKTYWSQQNPLPTTQEKTLHMDITRWSTPKSD